jgi:hypothetical protein
MNSPTNKFQEKIIMAAAKNSTESVDKAAKNAAAQVDAVPSKYKKVASANATPFVNFKNVGEKLEGRILRKIAEKKGKFGLKSLVQVETTADTTICWGKSKEPTLLSGGTVVQIECTAGLSDLYNLSEGTEFMLVFTSRLDTGKGNPAKIFDVYVA